MDIGHLPLFRRGSGCSRCSDHMMTRGLSRRKCRIALIAIARGYLNKLVKKIGPAAKAPEPDSEYVSVQAFTLDVIDAITIDAILN
jgi:hypothetical protein